MATFTVKGPFDVPVKQGKSGRVVTAEQANQFWENHPSIEGDVGCYVFAFRAGQGSKPVYVGKATKNFKQEVFTDHKKNKYNEGLATQGKGTPIMYFVMLNKTAGPVNKKAIDEVESYLIQSGLAANKNLLNDQKTAVEKWSINGVVRSAHGKNTNASAGLKKCFGL
ncbi:MAG: hypothetical protein HOO97_06310 [Sideroxydans sp.]|nr:hypothetical protein [Sideroxydans sp.]